MQLDSSGNMVVDIVKPNGSFGEGTLEKHPRSESS